MDGESPSLTERFRAKFPQLDRTVDDAEIIQAGDLVDALVGCSEDDPRHLYATAHLALAEKTDIAGDSMKIKVGGIERDFRTISRTGDSVFWSQTHFGRVYIQLERSNKVISFAG